MERIDVGNDIYQRRFQKTLTYGIMSFEGQYAVDWGTVGAGLSIATIPVLIFYLIFAEAFQKGIVAGAVKG